MVGFDDQRPAFDSASFLRTLSSRPGVYRMLDEAGLISTQHGRGTFILEPASEEKFRQLRWKDLQRMLVHFLNDADSLGFSPDDVSTVFDENIEKWQATGTPPDPDEI